VRMLLATSRRGESLHVQLPRLGRILQTSGEACLLRCAMPGLCKIIIQVMLGKKVGQDAKLSRSQDRHGCMAMVEGAECAALTQ
jgi:hypothetical protein